MEKGYLKPYYGLPQAVAELVGGSEPAFVEQMNARAASLGMEQTSFRNACGLDAEGHLSTARDVAAMSRTILNTCPEVLHYTGIWTDTLRGGATQLVNTNKLLRRYEGITGLKTGTTGGAGICISASATRNCSGMGQLLSKSCDFCFAFFFCAFSLSALSCARIEGFFSGFASLPRSLSALTALARSTREIVSPALTFASSARW